MILGLSNLDTEELDIIEQNYEEEVFKITSFFLNRAFVPKLAQAKIERLKKLEQAFAFFSGSKVEVFQFETIDFNFQNISSIEQLIIAEQLAEMQCKLTLSNSTSAVDAAVALDSWSQMVIQYAYRFVALFPSKGKEALKVASTLLIDYGVLLNEVKKGEMEGTAMQEFARLSRLI